MNNASIRLRRFAMNVKSAPHKYLALLLFLSISLPITYWGRYERSGWIMMTMPVSGETITNSLLGYTYLFGDIPVMRENVPFFDLAQLFNGVDLDMHFYFVRGLVGFAAAIFTPIFGVFGAYTLVNYLCWLVAAYIGWRFTYDVFADKTAALITVLLIAGGIGWTAHSGDYSAHTMSFTFYYLGIYLIYKSAVWQKEQPLKTHIFLGAFFGLATIQYNTGLYLIAGYLILALRRNRWRHIAAGVLLGMSGQIVWHAWLNIINILFNHAPGWTDYYQFEAIYRQLAVAHWLAYISDHTWLSFAFSTLIGKIIMFFDSPLIVILGLAGFFFLPAPDKPKKVHREGVTDTGIIFAQISNFLDTLTAQLRLFFLIFFTLPMLGSLFWSAAFTGIAKGYLIFGITLLLYSAFSGMISKLIHHPRRAVNIAGWSLLAVTLVTHLLWGSAYLWGYSVPVKVYFLGFTQNDNTLLNVKPEILSLTGHEPTPIILGGNVSLSSAGTLALAPKFTVSKTSFSRILFVRLPVFVYLAILLFASICILHIQISRRGINASMENSRVFAGFLMLWVLLALLALKPAKMPAGYNPHTIPIAQGETLQYEVSISKEFIGMLKNKIALYPESILMLHTGTVYENEDKYRFNITYDIGGSRINCKPFGKAYCQVEKVEFLRRMDINPKAAFTLRSTLGITPVLGWQNMDLPGRILQGSFQRLSALAPEMEIRLYHRDVRGNTYLLLAGF